MKRSSITFIVCFITLLNSQTINLDLIQSFSSPIAGSISSYFVGRYTAQLGDINGDGFDDWAVLLETVYDYGPGENGSRIYIYLGNDSIRSETPPDYIFSTGSPDIYFSHDISAAGDVNNDNYDDFMVKQISIDPVTEEISYYVSLFHGGSDLDSDVDLSIYPNMADLPSYFGVVSPAGDVNGDNYDDILIGAPQIITGPDSGHAYLYHGGENMDNLPDLKFTGWVNPDPAFGAEQYAFKLSAAGDMNNDGFDDFVIGKNSASAELYLGGPGLDSEADLLFTNLAGGGIAPLPAPAGDVNNDGFDDIIFGLYVGGNARIYYGGETVDDTVDVYMPNYGTYFGWDVTSAGDMNNDGFDDVAISKDWNSISAIYIFFGDSEMDSIADVVINDPIYGDQFGYSISGGGDLNNDGFDDMIIGAGGNSVTAWSSVDDAGHIYFIPGGETILDSAETVFSGQRPGGDGFGESIDYIGDMNNDGYSDLLIGANRALDRIYTAGEAYLFFTGPEADNVADVTFPTAQLGSNNNFGRLVSAAGDVNGDSIPDFLIANNTATFFFYGKNEIETTRDTRIQKAYHRVYSLAAVGDVNMDGYDDFLICSGQNGPTSAYLYLGRTSWITNVEDHAYAAGASAQFGESSSGGGDLNGDGFDDFIVGAPGINSALVWLGDSSMNKNYDVELIGENEDEYFGISVSGGHDLNGDGFSDIAVGALTSAYVYFGGDSIDNIADKVFLGDTSIAEYGMRVKTIPDINNDGYDEITVIGETSIYLYLGGNPMDNIIDLVLPGTFADIAVWENNQDSIVNFALGSTISSTVWVYQGEVIISSTPGSESALMPNIPVLYQNYPNPFNPITTISYYIPKISDVKLSIYNVLGQNIKTLAKDHNISGMYSIMFDAGMFSSGIYFYSLEVNGNIVQTKKLVLLK